MNAATHVIVIGRGHGGTRIPAQVLHDSGFYMGSVNTSYDLIPGDAMYNAVREVGRLVQQTGASTWDFSAVLDTPPTENYRTWVDAYLMPLLGHQCVAWKLPESILGLPWLVQLFPNAHYIHWVRDGRDNILGEHGTDNLRTYDVPVEHDTNRLVNAARSWVYHLSLVDATPKPKHWLTIRMRDFVFEQSAVLQQMSHFLGVALQPVPVYPGAVGRWRERGEDLAPVVPVMKPQLEAYGYC